MFGLSRERLDHLLEGGGGILSDCLWVIQASEGEVGTKFAGPFGGGVDSLGNAVGSRGEGEEFTFAETEALEHLLEEENCVAGGGFGADFERGDADSGF